MKTAFVICTRLASSRVPGKALMDINGMPVLKHLCQRLKKTGIKIILTTPQDDLTTYIKALGDDGLVDGWYSGYDDNPLGRTRATADAFDLDNVIRVCHDKIFVDPDQVLSALDVFNRRDLDYLYSSKFIDGSSFEIISMRALRKAYERYGCEPIEFIGYAVRSVTDNVLDFDPGPISTDARLLLDYPEDKSFLETLLSACGNDVSLADAVHWLERNPWAKRINALPQVTVYTCAYNAERFIARAMGSVAKQRLFRGLEYIIVDDHSTDATPQLIAKFCTTFKNARWIRNSSNLGLASSSNVALKNARGRFIIRLDADDFFLTDASVAELKASIEEQGKDVVIPNNFFGSYSRVQHGRDSMHVGGTIFRTRAVNHVKFTDGLRGYEGLDFFTRARDQLSIGYLNKPIFFYTQRPDSMSKTNLDDRTRIKQDIMSRASQDGIPI